MDAGPPALMLRDIGTWGLWIAAGLTLFTGYDYLRAGVVHMTESTEPARDADRGATTAGPGENAAAGLAKKQLGPGDRP